MKGALPVPYIVALILGIVVVALLGYWFFVIYGGGGGEATLTFCRGKELAYCTAWSSCGYQNCAPEGSFNAYASDCAHYNWVVDQDRCRELLRTTTT